MENQEMQLKEILERAHIGLEEMKIKYDLTPDQYFDVELLFAQVNAAVSGPIPTISVQEDPVPETAKQLADCILQLGELNFKDEIVVQTDNTYLDLLSECLERLRLTLKYEFERLLYYKNAFDNAVDFLIVTDSRFRIITSNKTIYEILGLHDDFLIGSNLNELFIKSVSSNTIKELVSGDLDSITTKVKDNSGTYHPCEIWIKKIDHEGSGHYYVTVRMKKSSLPVETKTIGSARHQELWKRIQRKLEPFGNKIIEWISTDEYRECTHIFKGEAEMLKLYILGSGDLYSLTKLTGKAFNEIQDDITKLADKTVEHKYAFFKWNSKQRTHQISLEDFLSMSNQTTAELLNILAKTSGGIQQKAFKEKILKMELNDTSLSPKLIKILQNNGCKTVEDILYQFDNPVKELERKRISKYLIEELECFLEGLF